MVLTFSLRRLDTKLPPYRILFQKEVNSMCLQIAVSESKSTIEAAWHWIERNMMPEIETIEHPLDKEHWVTEKINMLVTTLGNQLCWQRFRLMLSLYRTRYG